MIKAKRANYSLLLREMAAMGVPLDRTVDGTEVEIEQVGAPFDSIVFDLDDGRCGWMIDLIITRSIRVRDVALRPRWPNPDFECLPDPKKVGGDPYYYRTITVFREKAHSSSPVNLSSTMFCCTARS